MANFGMCWYNIKRLQEYKINFEKISTLSKIKFQKSLFSSEEIIFLKNKILNIVIFP